MNTTEIFVEHLITGLMTILWILLFILGFNDFSISNLALFIEFKGLSFILFSTMAYPIGIFTDDLADYLLKKWDDLIKEKYQPGKDKISVSKVLIEVKSEEMSKLFNYMRTKIRIARSASLNFFMLTISSTIFLSIHGHSLGLLNLNRTVITTCLSGIILTLWSLWSWRRTTYAFHKKTIFVYNEYKNIQNPSE